MHSSANAMHRCLVPYDPRIEVVADAVFIRRPSALARSFGSPVLYGSREEQRGVKVKLRAPTGAVPIRCRGTQCGPEDNATHRRSAGWQEGSMRDATTRPSAGRSTRPQAGVAQPVAGRGVWGPCETQRRRQRRDRRQRHHDERGRHEVPGDGGVLQLLW